MCEQGFIELTRYCVIHLRTQALDLRTFDIQKFGLQNLLSDSNTVHKYTTNRKACQK